MRMMLNRRDNGEDGKTENTQGRPDSAYSLQELLIFPQPMVCIAEYSVSFAFAFLSQRPIQGLRPRRSNYVP